MFIFEDIVSAQIKNPLLNIAKHLYSITASQNRFCSQKMFFAVMCFVQEKGSPGEVFVYIFDMYKYFFSSKCDCFNFEQNTTGCEVSYKILHLIEPDRLVNLGYANFPKNGLDDNPCRLQAVKMVWSLILLFFFMLASA